MMSSKTTKCKNYKGYEINNGKKKDFECYTKTLDQIVDITEYMVSKHSKTLFVRLDIRNSSEGEKILQRDDITRVIENFKRGVERKCKGPNRPDANLVWAAENEDSLPHYHLYIGVNGNAIQNGYTLLSEMNKAVQNKLKNDNQGLVEFCKSNGKSGIMVNRQSEDATQEMQKAIYAGSYLAKTRSKSDRGKGARISSASRLPLNWREDQKSKKPIFQQGAGDDSPQHVNHPERIEQDEGYTCMCPPPSDFIEFDE